MKLLTQKLYQQFPKLYANEAKKPKDIPVIAKIFNPRGSGTWYLTEFDGEDVFFGLCCIHEAELGYVSLAEMLGIGYLERDLYWTGTLEDAMKEEGYGTR